MENNDHKPENIIDTKSTMKAKLLILGLLFGTLTASWSQQRLTLDQCRERALEFNKELKISDEAMTSANSMKQAAATGYLPKLTGGAAYRHSTENPALLSADKFIPVGIQMPDGSFGFDNTTVNNSWTTINGQPVPLDANNQPFDPKKNPELIQWKNYAYLPKESLISDTKNTYTANLTLTQPIYMGGKIRETNKMAQQSIEVSKAQFHNTRSEVLFTVDQLFWQVVAVENKLKLAEQYRDLVELLTKDVKELVTEGVATTSDLLKVRVRLNEAELNVIKARNGLSLSMMALCQQIGLPVETAIQLESAPIELDAADKHLPSSLMTDVYGARPEIAMLAASVNVSESQIKIKRADYLPTVAMSASYSVMNPNPYNGYEPEFGAAWVVGVSVNVPIFSWGERSHKLDAARSDRNMNQYRLESAKEKIELQVQQSLYNVSEAVTRLEMTNENLASADENMRYAQEGYREGVVTLTDFMAAQTAWQGAYNETIEAGIGYVMSKVSLQKAQGTL